MHAINISTINIKPIITTNNSINKITYIHKDHIVTVNITSHNHILLRLLLSVLTIPI